MFDKLKWFYKSLAYDHNNTPSLGRHVALYFLIGFTFREIYFMTLAGYSVVNGNTEAAANLINAASSPISSAIGLLGTVLPYAVQKIWPTGGISNEQLNEGNES